MADTAARSAPSPRRHHWRFFRAGGFDQVRIETGADLRALAGLEGAAAADGTGGLDQKLWLALACPAHSVEFDRRTLALIDADSDKRIRAPELLAALRWTLSLVTDADALFAGHAALPLALIDASSTEGAAILASAKRILGNLGHADAATITPAQAADLQAIFAGSRLNGDGIVPPEAAPDAAVAAVMRHIVDLAGSRPDRGGLVGIGQAESDGFFAAIDAYAGWMDEAEKDAATLLPFGDATPAALVALQAVRAKIDDYFFRCRLAAFDPAAAAALNADAAAFAALAGADLSGGPNSLAHGPVAGFPLARVEAGRALPLLSGAVGGVNPAWADAMARFRDGVVVPLLGGRDALPEAEWRQVCDRLAPCLAWQGRKGGAMVEPLGIARVREIRDGGSRAVIATLIAEDQAVAPEFEAVAAVEKLARFVRDLVPLINNFVSFRDFYTRRARAIFQIGTLYIDGRSCDLCVQVDDAAKHAAMATNSRIYLLYCDCTRKGTTEKMTIAAGVTGGDADLLAVGRHGVFYDRQGNDWDAVVVRVVSHPISIREAFWMPFKKVGKFVGDQIDKFAAARSKAAETQMTSQLMATGAAAATGAPPPADPKGAAPAFDAGRFAGIFAAIGLALGAIGTALASVVTGLLNLTWWQIPLAIAGVILLISGPSMVIAAMKLRERNLGPILDANGWAVNARARINIPFGASLTQVAKLPPGAERALTDPYAEHRQPWLLYAVLIGLVILLWLAWHYGWLALAAHRIFGG
jgi:hypothetical protein